MALVSAEVDAREPVVEARVRFSGGSWGFQGRPERDLRLIQHPDQLRTPSPLRLPTQRLVDQLVQRGHELRLKLGVIDLGSESGS